VGHSGEVCCWRGDSFDAVVSLEVEGDTDVVVFNWFNWVLWSLAHTRIVHGWAVKTFYSVDTYIVTP